MKRFLLFLLVFTAFAGYGQNKKDASLNFQKIEPPFWYTHFKDRTLQLMVYGKNIGGASVQIDYPGVIVKSVDKAESPNYIFINLELAANVKAGKMPITFSTSKKNALRIDYELKEKSSEQNRILGFNNSDLIYLIMPDRFANGDPSNDYVKGMEQDVVKRDTAFSRHGGDLKGLESHLDYIKDLGATAIWLNPVLENNMPSSSYHGYAITDLYKIDARFGTNTQFVDYVRKAHSMGLKNIMDMVHNHIGLSHPWMKDLPFKTWLNQHETFTRTNYRLSTISDPHASELDRKLTVDGWFTEQMPDLNQRNPYVAKYLIQNSLWWIEYAGLDGIRMDTYPYPDKEFMASWCKAVFNQYPQFNIVGEVWVGSVGMEGYWTEGKKMNLDYASALPSVTDFPLTFAIGQALNEETGWDNGLSRIYSVLAEDFHYQDPSRNVIFLDNHDITRFFTVIKEDVKKYKMSLAMLMTLRGTPQVYYGAEIAMSGDGGYHPSIRKDMPGGWPNDPYNVFTGTNIPEREKDVLEYFKKLANWRKTNKAVQSGKLTHFIPADNCYVYFRYNETESVMVIAHDGKEQKALDTKRFAERLTGFTKGKNVLTGETLNDLGSITLQPQTVTIIELSK